MRRLVWRPWMVFACALIVPISARAQAPVVVAKPDLMSLNIQAVSTDGVLDQWLAERLLPRWMLLRHWAILIERAPAVPADAGPFDLAVDPLVRGQKTGIIVTTGDSRGGGPPGAAAEITVTEANIMKSGKTAKIALNIRPDLLPPDQYSGYLRLESVKFANPVLVPFDLKIRQGPLLPLLVILVGILVGRIMQGNSTPTAQMQLRLLPRLYQLQGNAGQVIAPGSYNYLSRRLRKLRERIEAGRETEAALTQALDGLEARVRSMLALQSLEREIAVCKVDPDLKVRLTNLVGLARTALIEEKLAEAQQTPGTDRAATRRGTGHGRTRRLLGVVGPRGGSAARGGFCRNGRALPAARRASPGAGAGSSSSSRVCSACSRRAAHLRLRSIPVDPTPAVPGAAGAAHLAGVQELLYRCRRRNVWCGRALRLPPALPVGTHRRRSAAHASAAPRARFLSGAFAISGTPP